MPITETFSVPTYYGPLAEKLGKEDFDAPMVDIVADDDTQALRLMLGQDTPSRSPPSIIVERQHGRWMVMLIPEDGGDQCGYVYMHDDGQTFVVSENYEPRIEWREDIPPMPEALADVT